MAYSPAHTSSDTESDMGCCGANSMLVALVSMGLRIVDRFLCGKGLLQMKGLGSIAEECAGYNSGMIDQVECGLSNSCQMALAIIEEHAAERDVTDLENTLPAGWCSVVSPCCPFMASALVSMARSGLESWETFNIVTALKSAGKIRQRPNRDLSSNVFFESSSVAVVLHYDHSHDIQLGRITNQETGHGASNSRSSFRRARNTFVAD
jgi:hypothetical protein